MMEVIKTLKGGSLSKTCIISDGKQKFVRKYISMHDHREYGLVRWQSQIRKLQILNYFLPSSTIEVLSLGEDSGFYFYDLPFLSSHVNCFEALIQGENPEILAEKIAELIIQLSSVSFGKSRGNLSIYITEEIRTPLLLAKKNLADDKNLFTCKEVDEFSQYMESGLEKIAKISNKLCSVEINETLTHGNLTLENILWNKYDQSLVMIDPYAETYCEYIMGDVSQLLQSSSSGYEYISILFDSNDFSLTNYPLNQLPNSFKIFGSTLINHLSTLSWYSEEYLKLLVASQFTRMFPFKYAKSRRQAYCFMMHGLELISKI